MNSLSGKNNYDKIIATVQRAGILTQKDAPLNRHLFSNIEKAERETLLWELDRNTAPPTESAVGGKKATGNTPEPAG